MEDYLTELNHINATNYTKNDIFCSHCSKVFAKSFYTDGTTPICKECFDKDTPTTTYIEIPWVKDLSCLLFPCKFENCKYFGKDISCHQEQCLHGPLVCPFDKKEFKDTCNSKFAESDYVKHLSEHGQLKTIHSKTLKLNIKIDLSSDYKTIYLILYKIYSFVLFIQQVDNAVVFRMTEYGIHEHVDTFQVVHKFQNKETSITGKMLRQRIVFDEIDAADNVMVPKALLELNPQITLYISDHEIFKMNFGECPVCLNNVIMQSGLCQNGHTVCESCLPKMKSCPICRDRMQASTLNLPRLFPNFKFLCSNHEAGCLVLCKGENIADHKDECLFEKVICPECKVDYNDLNLYKHFRETHLSYKNFSFHDKTFSTEFNDTIYILYRVNIFLLKIKYVENELRIQMEMHNASEDYARCYRYELDLLKDSSVIARASSICTGTNSNKYSTSIALIHLKDLLFNDKMWTIRYQCKIIYCDTD